MSTKTKTMWTRQVPQVWEELRQSGVYRVKQEYIEIKNDTMADYYLNLYKWYTNEARKHMYIPKELEYPIWLSLDVGNMLQPVEDTVILEVDIPEDQYIICNMDNWGYRVNYWYIPEDAGDKKRHDEEIKKYAIVSEDDLVLTDKGNFYPMLQRKIIGSWERVFTVQPTGDQEVAATAWELKREWVKEVRFYEK